MANSRLTGSQALLFVLLQTAAGCAPSGDADHSGRPTPPSQRAGESAPTDSEATDPLEVHASSAALSQLASCGEVETALRAAVSRDMRRALKQQRDQLLMTAAAACRPLLPPLPAPEPLPSVATPSASGTAATTPSAPDDVSGTNNQVASVDEADFVKNDDHYIYLLADGALQIIAAWPPQDTHVITKLALPEQPRQLFVHDDRALVLSSVRQSGSTPAPACTYGYDCEFSGDGSPTRVDVYDLSDREHPKLTRTLTSRSSLLSARRIDDGVHLALYRPLQGSINLPSFPTDLQTFPRCGAGAPSASHIRASFRNLADANDHTIADSDLNALVGDNWSEAILEQPDAPRAASCDRFYVSDAASGLGLLSLASFSMLSQDEPTVSSVVSRPGASYASDGSYYLAVAPEESDLYGTATSSADAHSAVHRFALDGAQQRYVASAEVPGHVLNQFSMDEYQGHLRVATSLGRVPDPKVRSQISVLDATDDQLTALGSVADIAPGEDIRAVRFMGDKGYVVTFKKTDPLFVLDLADAQRPALVGEIKIPGFSTYMQALDDTHLLTIGYDADDQGSFAWFAGIRLQIFDVSDPTAPQLDAAEVIGTRGSASSAATDHLAFNYFAPKQILALPITVCEGGMGSNFGSLSFSGVMFYHVDANTGFSLTGRSEHPYNAQSGSVGDACGDWWSQATSLVKRTVFMDDFAYELSDVRLKVDDIRDLSHSVKTVPLR